MIFLTVGTQYPFDRLVTAVDAWAATHTEPVVAQIGDSTLSCSHIDARPWVTQDEFDDFYRSARLIVSHGGIGSLITARELGKPIMLMPRRAGYREHRDDHQVYFCEQVQKIGLALVAWNEDEIGGWIDRMLAGEFVATPVASKRDQMIDGLRGMVRELL